eukprot:5705854-Heterocapsa_arctica.AAC.1
MPWAEPPVSNSSNPACTPSSPKSSSPRKAQTSEPFPHHGARPTLAVPGILEKLSNNSSAPPMPSNSCSLGPRERTVTKTSSTGFRGCPAKSRRNTGTHRRKSRISKTTSF